MKLEKDTTISHYKILSEIGKGGMGEVYLAQDTKLNRKVAIKFLSEEWSKDSDKLNRFVQEAQSASALNHPNIITIHEIGETDNTQYIALEYIEGETLTSRLKKKLKFNTALDIATQIASALDAAHSAGIVHRDIKPDNVMIRKDGFVKILDFGIAKLTEKSAPEIESEDKTAVQVNTTPGMIIGTANYMSPEQAKGKEVDKRTDVFSFGVVLYEMIAGGLPFEGESPLEIIGSILNKEPKTIDNVEVPAEVERIISKTLRKDRNERYQTIKDVLIDLKDAKQDLEFQDKLDKTIQPNRDEQSTQVFKATTVDEQKQTTTVNDSIAIKKSSFNKIAVGVSAILLISAIGFGYWYFSSGNQIDSIAVMPFVNESGDKEVEYLSDGMTETLIGSLSKLPNLEVKPRSSVFRYKGKETDVKTIGKELNVQAILNGRVVQRGEQLTLSLELIDVQKNSVLWSERYIRKQSELVALQSEIAKDVSTKLKSKLSGEDEAKVANIATANPEAYQAFLRGRFYWNKRTGETLKKAIEQFKVAVEKDPNYALAYVGLADSYVLLSEYTRAPLSESLSQAKSYAKRAIAIDDQLGEPHATLGLANHRLWKWKEAEREYKRAIELSPNYATAYQWYFRLLVTLGRFDEGALMIKRAQELDPLSIIITLNLSVMYQLQNDHDASIENSRKIIELDPNFSTAYDFLGRSLLAKGRNAEAIANFEKLVELSNRADWVLGDLGYAFGVSGKRTEATAIAKELEELYAKKKTTGLSVAKVYAGLGEKNKAFEWLEKDFESRADMGNIRWEFGYEPLRNDPRFKDLLKRMGLPE